MENRRKHPRLAPKEFLKVFDRTNNILLGELVNLSSEGAMLVTPGPIKASTVFKCRVILTQEILGRGEITFEAECRWCRKNIPADRWESGYRLQLNPQEAEMIEYLSLGFKLCDWGDEDLREVRTTDLENRRRSVRYELEEPYPVFELQSYRQIGVVADLSVDGMRLITSKPIAKDAQFSCRVKLPTTIFREDYLMLDVKCMWSRKRETTGDFESGYSIVKLSKEDAAIILHLLIHSSRAQKTKPRVQVFD